MQYTPIADAEVDVDTPVVLYMRADTRALTKAMAKVGTTALGAERMFAKFAKVVEENVHAALRDVVTEAKAHAAEEAKERQPLDIDRPDDPVRPAGYVQPREDEDHDDT